MSLPRIFVSYTTLDGALSDAFLLSVESWFSGVSRPFVHRPIASPPRLEQFRVIHALLRSHLLVVLDSPSVQKSRWVRLEIFIGRLKMMPIIRVPASDFHKLMETANKSIQTDDRRTGRR